MIAPFIYLLSLVSGTPPSDFAKYEFGAVAMRTVGGVYLHDGNFALASRYLDKSITAEPSYATAYVQRGMCYYRSATWQKAYDNYTTALNKDPYNTSALLFRSATSLKMGDCDRAIVDINRAHSLNNNDLKVLLFRAELFMVKKDWARAALDLDRAMMKNGQNTEQLIKRACCKFELGKYDEAIIDYNTVLLIDPKNSIALFQRCNSLAQKKEWLLCLSGLKDLLAVDSNNFPGLLLRGYVHQNSGRADQALLEFDSIVEKFPGSATALCCRALCHTQLGNLGRALRDYNTGLAIDPNSVTCLWNRASIYNTEGRYDLAIEDFTRVHRIDPSRIDCIVERGICKYHKQSFADALVDFDKVLSVTPKYPEASLFRSRILIITHKYELADQELTNYIKLVPDSPTAFYYKAITACERNLWKDSVLYLDTTIAKDPAYADAFANRAWISSTCPDANIRSGQRAIKDATRACELTNWSNPEHLAILAASHAEAGNFGLAVRWQLKALDDPMYKKLSGIKAYPMLAKYLARKPHHIGDDP